MTSARDLVESIRRTLSAALGEPQPQPEDPEIVDPDDPERPAIDEPAPDEVEAPRKDRPGPDPPARRPGFPPIGPSRIRRLRTAIRFWPACTHNPGVLVRDRVNGRAVLRCPSCFRYREIGL